MVTWAGEQTVPRQGDGSYVAPMSATTGLGPGFYGVTVSAAPVGASWARTSAAGQVVRRLRLGFQGPGEHAATWDGGDDADQVLSSGVYFCRLDGSGLAPRKLLLLR